ncbi:MAG: patatin-like phospholipase family protein [bacterium]
MLFKKKKLGLALGGGAAKGLAHIGILKVLEENDIRIDFVSGTSMGAIIGAMYASGMSASEIESVATGLDKKEAASLFRITLDGAGFINGERITGLLEDVIHKKKFTEMEIPFACVACDIVTGREIVFTEGNIINSLRASMSIPGIFSPVKNEGNVLVDGGLVNPVPADTVRDLGADRVLAVNVLTVPELKHKNLTLPQTDKEIEEVPDDKGQFIDYLNKRVKNFVNKEKTNLEAIAKRVGSIFNLTDEINILDIMSQTMHLAESRIAEYKLEADEPDLLVKPDMTSINHFDFIKAEEAIAIGEKAARDNIDKIRKLI